MPKRIMYLDCGMVRVCVRCTRRLKAGCWNDCGHRNSRHMVRTAIHYGLLLTRRTFIKMLEGERHLAKGQANGRNLFRSATHHLKGRCAWQRLGDALAASDRSAARKAWLTSFKNTRLPLPWPGAPCVEPHVFRSLSDAFSNVEDYERVLRRFPTDQVRMSRPKLKQLVFDGAPLLQAS